jgi:nitrite reductase/ring-hydroxylating ferredoxin subunit/DMSO/TMAO reductase YedYZ heme-binding membrane subunit
MSSAYRAVNWNRQKFIYDGVLAGGVVAYLALFVGLTLRDPEATLETALIRGLGTASLVLLHLILCLGPLARLDRRWLPLLYNRRHLGVTMALLALGHALFSLIQFHALGDVNPFVSLLTGSADLRHISSVPFELFGAAALVIIMLMAATSHDFWLSVLQPAAWKALHMLVYLAYVLLIIHVAFGSMQSTRSPWLAITLGIGASLVFGLHLLAGWRGRTEDHAAPQRDTEGWVRAGRADTIREGRARMALVGEDKVAIFRHEGQLFCVSNVCRHQNGPLGEGRIVDGCITCPWHGYQYLPHNGQSPPPFTEKVETFNLRLVGGEIFVDPHANPPGTPVTPVTIARSGPHG